MPDQPRRAVLIVSREHVARWSSPAGSVIQLLPHSGCENRAEPDAVFHHLGEGLLRLLELEDLDARADAIEDAEGDGLLGIDRAAAGPARDALPAEQRQPGDLQRLYRCGDDEELAPRLQAVDGARDGLAVGRRRQDEVGSPKLLQAFGRADLLRVDVLVRAELLSELPLVRAARYGDGPEAHARGELDAEMAEAADALDRHGVARARAAIAEGVVGRDAGAEQRRGFGGVQILGNARGGFVRHDHVLGVPAVVADAGDLFPLAVDEEALATGVADEAVAAVPADAYPVALLPLGHVGANFLDPTGDLVARNARIRNAWIGAELHQRIAVTDSAGFYLDADLPRRGLRKLVLDRLECAAGLRHLDGPHHLRHGCSSRSSRFGEIPVRCTCRQVGANLLDVAAREVRISRPTDGRRARSSPPRLRS